MNMRLAYALALLALAGSVSAQTCPNGIPRSNSTDAFRELVLLNRRDITLAQEAAPNDSDLERLMLMYSTAVITFYLFDSINELAQTADPATARAELRRSGPAARQMFRATGTALRGSAMAYPEGSILRSSLTSSATAMTAAADALASCDWVRP